MSPNRRPETLPVSVRCCRAAAFVVGIGSTVFLAAMTVAALASPQAVPMLTNVDRVDVPPPSPALDDAGPPADPSNDVRPAALSPFAGLPVPPQEAVTTSPPDGTGQSVDERPAGPMRGEDADGRLDGEATSAQDAADIDGVNVEIVETSEADLDGAEEIRWYDGRPIRPKKTMTMTVTAYSPDERSCGDWADGYTASGYSVWTNGMKLLAADTSILPFGSLVTVPGYDDGNVVPVLDRGGAIKGKRLDVLYPTHERAMQWGVQELEVTIWEYADGEPCHFRTQHQNHPDYGTR